MDRFDHSLPFECIFFVIRVIQKHTTALLMAFNWGCFEGILFRVSIVFSSVGNRIKLSNYFVFVMNINLVSRLTFFSTFVHIKVHRVVPSKVDT